MRCGSGLPNPSNLLREPYNPEEWYPADVEWVSDSNRLTAYCIDTADAGSLTLTRVVPPDGGLHAETVTYTYALTNDEAVPTATGMLFDLEAGTRTDFDLPPQPILYYYGHWWNYDEDSDQFFWMSDRTGWSHLYTIDGTTHALNQVTDGDWRFRYVARLHQVRV